MLGRLLMAVTTLWLVAPAAHADTLPNIYAGLVGGVAVPTEDPDPGPNAWGFGLGARAGLTLPLTDIYLGGFGIYHFGEEVGGVDASTYMVGGEAGYELSLGPIVLRPSLGFGYAGLATSASAADDLADEFEDQTGVDVSVDTDADEGGFYLSPGANLMVTLLGLMAGAEVRYNGVFNENIMDSISLLATVGLAI